MLSLLQEEKTIEVDTVGMPIVQKNIYATQENQIVTVS